MIEMAEHEQVLPESSSLGKDQSNKQNMAIQKAYRIGVDVGVSSTNHIATSMTDNLRRYQY